MIEVDIKLNPFGSDQGIRKIGSIYIANVGRSLEHGCMNYVYMIYEPESRFSDEVLLHGVITGYNLMQPSTKLLQAIMKDYGGSACKLSERYVNIWLTERLDLIEEG